MKLTGEDALVAAVKGTVRQIKALQKGRMGHDHGSSSTRSMSQSWIDHILGELGEIAVSRELSLNVSSLFEDMAAADVAGKLEIRCTEYANGHLPLHKTSKDESPYVLVLLDGLEATIAGWIIARDGKKAEYWRKGNPDCFFVPQKALLPIDQLLNQAPV